MPDRKTKISVLLWITGLLLLFVVYCIGLSTNPPGFYVDESGIAYNAYLLGRTGAGEFGPKLPIFFQFFTAGYTQWVSPSQVYLLAIVLLVAPPTVLVTRIFSAFWLFSACVLLGLLGKRISGKTSVGVIIGAAALTTPWFFEIRGVLMEPHFIPMALVLVLYTIYQAQTREIWKWHDAVKFAASLALLTYAYSSGRMLAPLLAAGLIIFVTRQRLKIVLMTWGLYGLALVPIVLFNWFHPGALTSRFWAATWLKPDMPWTTAVFEFASRYLQDVNPQCLLDTGDVVVRHHVPGFYGPFFYSIFFLAVTGLFIVLIRRTKQRWWLFALYGLAIAPVPGAMTFEPCHAMRQMAIPVFLFVMAIPAVHWFLTTKRHSDHEEGDQEAGDHEDPGPPVEKRRPTPSAKWMTYVKPVILGLILTVTVIEAVRFQYHYRDKGPNRHIYFDAGYKEAFDVAVAQARRPIYLLDGYGPTYITGFWYAIEEGLPASDFEHVPPGTRPPPDAVVLSSETPCGGCEVLSRNGVFSVFVTGPAPETPNVPAGPAVNEPKGGGVWSAGQFSKPRGIAADGKGNIYVADTANKRIQKFAGDGELLFSIDSGQAGSGELREPLGITVDRAGNIYVTDGTTNRLTKFGPNGKFIKEWEGPEPAFYGPRDVVAAGSHIFVLDQGHWRVVKFDPETASFQQWGSNGSGEGQFNELTGIDATDDRIFVADARNDRIQVFDLNGKFISQWPVPQWAAYIWHFPDVAVDKESGRVYATSGWTNEVLVFDMNGNLVESIKTGPTLTLDNPSSLAIAKTPAGKRLYILNTANLFVESPASSVAIVDLPATETKKQPKAK